MTAPRPSDAPADLSRLVATDPAAAIDVLRPLLAASPHNAEAHRLHARALRQLGRTDEAEQADIDAIAASAHDPELQQAARALHANRLGFAEPILKARLKAQPFDVAAIRMLAEVAGRIGRNRDAENLLRRALELAPRFHAARHNLALHLHRHGNPAEALEHVEQLAVAEPENATYVILKAAILGQLGEYGAAVDTYRDILARYPRQAKVWMSLGHALKTVGQQDESIAAYRESLRLQPALGSSWWSLANLKTFRFTEADREAMQAALATPGIEEEDRFQIHFALGKAEEDARDFASSFGHYAEGNRRRRALLDYDPAHLTEIVDRQRATLDPTFFAERKDWGYPAPDPIFVVSLPRSGSTLIEQVLASHSLVEGTMELPDIGMLAGSIGPQGIVSLTATQARELGEQYIERTRVQRKSDSPYFVDKMPNNWTYVSFIKLILPNAKIVDARRHPLGCGFSVYKQHFARGQSFSYDLTEIGLYYRDYVRAMAHVDRVLPGAVHRVIYEQMVEDSETQIRALIDHIGLPFEDQCLRFHETERAVRTASSEQVRRPIFREAIDHWRNYTDWLEPLRAPLGPILDHYPDVPPGL